MTSDEAYKIAVDAVRRLVKKEGANAKFPFDRIWDYSKEIPSAQRPALAQRLIRAGYLETTGMMTRAVSEARAGSPTREFRPGPEFAAKGQGSPTKKLSTVDALRRLPVSLEGAGFLTTPADLANFYLALKASPLVILAGISGSGKSRLPRLFAEQVGALFTSIPVKPDWDDNSDLFGYTPAIHHERFIEGPFTKAIKEASQSQNRLSVFLLDEMNLAAVEHYFSDFLSVIETRRREDGVVLTDRLPLDLPLGQAGDTYAELRDLRLPRNVRVVGTANMDETTRGFSPKVLDRAFSIEFDEVDLAAFPGSVPAMNIEDLKILASRITDPDNPVSVVEGIKTSQELFEEAAALLGEVRDILRDAGISFAYRTRDAVCLYLWHWHHDSIAELLPKEAALDFCILQKVLPKVYGQGERLEKALERLLDWFEEDNRGFARSADKTRRMIQRLKDDGATTFWGA
jgi:MoxR-like ATPase